MKQFKTLNIRTLKTFYAIFHSKNLEIQPPYSRLHGNHVVLAITFMHLSITSVKAYTPLFFNHLTVLYHARETPSFLIRANNIKKYFFLHMQKSFIR